MRLREITKLHGGDQALNRVQDHLRDVLNPWLRRLADVSSRALLAADAEEAARFVAALAGTSGTPSGSNKYVTNTDPRLGGSSGPVLSVSVTSPITNSGTAIAPVIGASVGVLGGTLAAGNDSRFPTTGEKAALAGTSGTPSSGNKFVTDSDPRLAGGSFVQLQATTPGTPQTGHSNITGTAKAGAMVIPTLSGDVIGSSGSVETAVEALDDSQHSEGCSGLGAWQGAGTYYTITGGALRLDRAGYGYIRGVRVAWTAPQTTSALTANATTYVYVNSSGVIGTTTTASRALYQDNIVLFEVLNDGTNIVVVRDDHPYEYDNAASHWTHNVVGTVIGRSVANASSVGADITRVATGTGGATGDREVKIVGAARIFDHGVETDIPDSAGAGVTWNVYLTNGSGKWVRYAQQTQLPMIYNAAGTATALTAGRYGIFRLYVSKDDKNTTTPTYFAVMHTAQYTAVALADSDIANGATATITNELLALELAQLGFAIVKNSGGGYIDHLTIQKAVVGGGIAGGGSSNLAALVTVDTTNFSGALTSADSNVQAALETLDDKLAAPVAETPSGTVNGSNTVFTLANTPGAAAGVIVTLDGVTQRNGTDYTVSGTTITFVAAPASGTEIFAYYNVVATGGGASGAAGGDLSGTYPNPIVAKVQGVAVSSGAPTSGQVFAYNGSQWAPTTLAMANLISAMQGRQLWVPPLVADSRNDEFDSGTLTGWTSLGTPSATAIDPYAGFSGVGWRSSVNSYRPSWLMIQADPTFAATLQKTISFNTNDLVWTRMAAFRRAQTGTANDEQILLSISDTARTSRVDIILARYDGAAPVVRLRTFLSGGFTTNGEVAQGPTVNDIEYLALQKLGSTIYGWCAAADGQWRYVGTTTPAITYTSVLVGAQNADTTTPGNMITGVDFVRFLNSATQLP